MQSLEIQFVFRDSEEEQLTDLLTNLQAEIGGERSSYSGRNGAIDLVSYLDIAIGFTAGAALRPILQKYFEGLFNADGLKKVGEDHSAKIKKWFVKLEKDIYKITDVVQNNLNMGLQQNLWVKKTSKSV